MFKNRALKVTMIKDEPQEADRSKMSNIDPEQINKIAKDQIKYIAVATVSIFTAKSVVTVARSAALHAVHAKFK